MNDDPPSRPEQIEQIVARGLAENEYRDWKESWIKPKRAQKKARELSFDEAAKDCAALMNRDGGYILVGIADDGGDRARAIVTTKKSSSTCFDRRSLRSALTYRLSPAEAATAVDVLHVDVEAPSGRETVAVVTVKPWIGGPVAVRCEQDRLSYRFPVRSGAHTDYLSLDEVQMTDWHSRDIEMRIRSWSSKFNGSCVAVVCSPIFWVSSSRIALDPVMVYPARRGGHGQITEVDRDGFLLTLNDDVVGKGEGQLSRKERGIRVPYGHVERVLLDHSLGSTVQLVFKDDLVFDGEMWSLRRVAAHRGWSG